MKKANWLFLALALVLSVTLAACNGGSSEETSSDSSSEGDAEGSGDSEQVLNIIETAEIPTMDASLAADAVTMQWLATTTDGLYRLGENTQPEPGIAKEHTVSDDGLTWTFTLREDATWSNGDPVTAHDFVFAWQRAVNPDTGSEYGPYMMGGVIKNATSISEGETPVEELGVKAVDDYTLEVNLEKPTPYFESMTTFGTFLPLNQEFVENHGEDYGLEAETLLSNGPFVLSEWNHGQDFVLKKNENYWDADKVKLNQINVSIVKETASAVNLYETGEIDRVNLTSEFVDEYRTSEEFRTIEEPTVFYLKLNQEHEVLSNVNARKALQLAIDRQSMVDVILNNGSIPSGGVVPASFTQHPETGEDFREINGTLVESNLEKAKELWAKAKEELGVQEVELGYIGGDTEVSQNLDAYIKDQLEQLEGLTINVESLPFQVKLDRDKSMDYDIQSTGWAPDYMDPNTFLNIWVTDGGNNKTGYSSKEYDALIEKAGAELAQKPVERFETFLEAEKMLIQEDAVLVPLYQRALAQLKKPYVKNVSVNPMSPDYTYKYAYIEGK
ncbi:peptide ABC transporter substrate-binding protein [Halobacillus shinanisalinarum]|uniref:Peptide ABC transporter substrate-binding protein n=1 Tax=Halobacillus shinanisalinarum TaxID=2932258 RepID=A0ABY4GVH8_9BACI|nr:peptide ABC transporter substrate-binding protein [Halobacillus shinanisalinarum]UOQ92171.1 peptide ABC transporter substrate-binding protein [Halobacillus shinanisalinarum]